MTEKDPLAVQIGGQHYKGMMIQPIEFAMVNGWDAAAFSVLKYLSRWQLKGAPVTDISKAQHFTELRQILHSSPLPLAPVVEMAGYCSANGIHGQTRRALLALADWVQTGETSEMRRLIEITGELHAEATEAERMKHIALNGNNGEHY